MIQQPGFSFQPRVRSRSPPQSLHRASRPYAVAAPSEAVVQEAPSSGAWQEAFTRAIAAQQASASSPFSAVSSSHLLAPSKSSLLQALGREVPTNPAKRTASSLPAHPLSAAVKRVHAAAGTSSGADAIQARQQAAQRAIAAKVPAPGALILALDESQIFYSNLTSPNKVQGATPGSQEGGIFWQTCLTRLLWQSKRNKSACSVHCAQQSAAPAIQPDLLMQNKKSTHMCKRIRTAQRVQSIGLTRLWLFNFNRMLSLSLQFFGAHWRRCLPGRNPTRVRGG